MLVNHHLQNVGPERGEQRPPPILRPRKVGVSAPVSALAFSFVVSVVPEAQEKVHL